MGSGALTQTKQKKKGRTRLHTNSLEFLIIDEYLNKKE